MRFRARELRDALGMVPDEYFIEFDGRGNLSVYNEFNERVCVVEDTSGPDPANYQTMTHVYEELQNFKRNNSGGEL